MYIHESRRCWRNVVTRSLSDEYAVDINRLIKGGEAMSHSGVHRPNSASAMRTRIDCTLRGEGRETHTPAAPDHDCHATGRDAAGTRYLRGRFLL